MNLLWIKLNGFKRFVTPTRLDCSGKIIALLGPNEAGKSSCLEAILHLSNDEPIQRHELSRDNEFEDNEIIIKAEFSIEQEDLDELAKSKLPQVSRFCISKSVCGERFFSAQPEPTRDLHLRIKLSNALKRFCKSINLDDDEQALFDRVISNIDNEYDTIDPTILNLFEEIGSLITSYSHTNAAQYITHLPNDLDHLHALESSPHPRDETLSILEKRIPEIVIFTDDDRNLRSSYNLQSIVEKGDSHKALDNLASAADLDLYTLWSHMKNRSDAEIETMRTHANDTLDKILQEHWSQSDIRIRFYVEHPRLKIQIEDPGRRFTSLGSRSDGLRQFVALLAFCTFSDVSNPIILIDEAELHLHYDGQADLIQMFQSQNVAKKVIYTTHSIGCLPEDLGLGVRMVDPKNSSSEFVNWFWHNGAAGFSPILMGIGAQTLAFFPVRSALVAEGASDMILLPTLIREATRRDSVGYQIVPGLSNSAGDTIRELNNAGSSVVYLVDNDEGGERCKKKLLKAGIPDKAISSIADSRSQVRTIEDFISPNAFLLAINQLIQRWNDSAPILTKTDLPNSGRSDSIKNWCDRNRVSIPSKRAIAYELLDLKASETFGTLLASKRAAQIRRLDTWVRERLK